MFLPWESKKLLFYTTSVFPSDEICYTPLLAQLEEERYCLTQVFHQSRFWIHNTRTVWFFLPSLFIIFDRYHFQSSLLKLILRELGLIDGQVNVSGYLSYASQEPWLFKGSVKSNIIFNEPYHKSKYDQVVDACALVEDFDQLLNRDETVVEENGVNLSGGQCARINLAR